MGDVVNFSRKERAILDSIVTSSTDSKQFQRAQALRWLDDGESVEEVASRLYVSRQSIYNWLRRAQAEPERGLARRLADAPRSGRPRPAQGVIAPLIEQMIATDPREFGYRSTGWTAALLGASLADYQPVEAPRRSVGYALDRLDIRWKFPRYDLARCSPTWRQAKGGANTGCGRARGRSS